MFRTTTITAVALTAAAFALPAGAGAASVDAAAHLEAHAVADSGAAVRQVDASTQRAKELISRSAAKLRRAYSITTAQGAQASGRGLEAAAQFSAAADAQGNDLSAIVEDSKGSLRAMAASVLARTGRLEARLVAQVATGLEQQNDSTSSAQGDSVSEVGDDHASLTASIVVAASDDGVRRGLQARLDKTTAIALSAQAQLVQAVADLRRRSEGDGQAGMAQAQASLRKSGEQLSQAVRSSGRADVSFSVDNGHVTLGEMAQQTVVSGDSPVSASAQGEGHVAVDRGGRS